MISKEKRNEKEIYKIFMKGVMPLKCPYCSTINYITAKDVTRRHCDNSRRHLRSVTHYYFNCSKCDRKITRSTNFNKYKADIKKLPFLMKIKGYFIRNLDENEQIYPERKIIK